VAGVTVRAATTADIAAMTKLWSKVAPRRDFAMAWTTSSLGDWIAAAPGLSIDDYRLAFDAGGRLLGFYGMWDQEAFKQMRITTYSAKLAAVRAAYNLVVPAIGGSRLPRAGEVLRQRTAVHVCVTSERADALRALVIDTHNSLCGSGVAFFNVGLDRCDPLSAAFRGLFAQHTDVLVCLASRQGRHSIALDGRPVHHEIALV
jgi:hypothetical protein